VQKTTSRGVFCNLLLLLKGTVESLITFKHFIIIEDYNDQSSKRNLVFSTIEWFTVKTIPTKEYSITIYKIPTEISLEKPLKTSFVRYNYTTLKSYRWITFMKYLSFSTNFSASHTNCLHKYRFTRDNTSKSISYYSGCTWDNNYFQNRSSVRWQNLPHTSHAITAATYKNPNSLQADSSLWLQKDNDLQARIFTNHEPDIFTYLREIT
jgi:hypothetical protein